MTRFKADPAKQLVRPQAARFRIWEYRFDAVAGHYRPHAEVLPGGGVTIEWTVHLANRKASFVEFDGSKGEASPAGPLRNAGVTNTVAAPNRRRQQLDIDPLRRTISGFDRGDRSRYRFAPGTSATPAVETWPTLTAAPATPVIDYLGELRTDARGRLIVTGGKGLSRPRDGVAPIGDYANNDEWFDDVSDGPVTATLKISGVKKPVAGAWVLVGPPDFAPWARNLVTLHDLLADLAIRELDLSSLHDPALARLKEIKDDRTLNGGILGPAFKASFDDEIFPLLSRATDASSVFAPARQAHVLLGGGDAPAATKAILGLLSGRTVGGDGIRQSLLARLRTPASLRARFGLGNDMPRLLGDEPYDGAHPRYRLTVTETQYLLLRQWAANVFHIPAADPPPPAPQPPPATPLSPAGLDRAGLETCVGGAFYPGIEVGWQIRDKDLFAEPFRINHAALAQHTADPPGTTIGAGHFSRQMALPWQADFQACKTEDGPNLPTGHPDPNTTVPLGWWPAQRPDYIYVNDAQVVAMAGTVTSGTFTLKLTGPPTAPIAHDADRIAVHDALVALAAVEPGDVEVLGGPLPGAPVTVVFTGAFSLVDVPTMTATSSLIGLGATVNVTEVVTGQTEMVAWHRKTKAGQWRAGNPEVEMPDMPTEWGKLGFVVAQGSRFGESERSASVP